VKVTRITSDLCFFDLIAKKGNDQNRSAPCFVFIFFMKIDSGKKRSERIRNTWIENKNGTLFLLRIRHYSLWRTISLAILDSWSDEASSTASQNCLGFEPA